MAFLVGVALRHVATSRPPGAPELPNR
jgi:hypothetical protein